MRWVLVGVLGLAGLAAVGYYQIDWQEPPPLWPPGAIIPVEEIAALYRDDEAAADRELRGRPVRVAVSSVQISWPVSPPPGESQPYKGPPTVHVTAGLWPIPTTTSGHRLALGDVEFRFPDLAALGGLQPGQSAVIDGVCRGVERHNVGTRDELRFLVFENCRVVGP
jgi:hypothetical protein